MGRTHWNERWYCRFKPDNCEPFTIQVPCLSWRYNKRDQQGDRKVAGAASNTEKEPTQNIAHGHDDRNTHFFAEEALQFWNCVLSTLMTLSVGRNAEPQSETHREVFDVDHVLRNIAESANLATFVAFDENATNLRHVSRTHRVNLGRLLERISLDSSIEPPFVRTRYANQRIILSASMVTFIVFETDSTFSV